MKLLTLLVLFCLSCPATLFAQPWWSGAKPAIGRVMPVAAQCNVSQCQQNCYLQKSQCGRDDDSGCGAKMQACMQACTACQ